MNKLLTYSLIAVVTGLATATFAGAVGNLVIELFGRTLNSFPS